MKRSMILLSIVMMLAIVMVAFGPTLVAHADGVTPPGQAQAGSVGAQCGTGAASGAFGYFAHGYIPANYSTPRGADGTQTGLNNSGVCGNRQGNLLP